MIPMGAGVLAKKDFAVLAGGCEFFLEKGRKVLVGVDVFGTSGPVTLEVGEAFITIPWETFEEFFRRA